MCSWLKRTKQWELRTVQGLIVWHMLPRYTPKLDGSKISNLPIDRVYPIYVHYGKFKGKPTYPDAINLYLQDTHVFSCIRFNNSLPHSCGGLLGFSKCEWEKKRENMKCEGTTLEGKWKVICKVQMKSHFFGFGFGFYKWCDWLINFFDKIYLINFC